MIISTKTDPATGKFIPVIQLTEIEIYEFPIHACYTEDAAYAIAARFGDILRNELKKIGGERKVFP